MLRSTKGLLSPGDLVAYQQCDPRGKSKSSAIASLFDPSTQDKKEIILENGDIIRPFIHEVNVRKCMAEKRVTYSGSINSLDESGTLHSLCGMH